MCKENLIKIKENSVILFQGDSITDCFRKRDDEYDLGEGYPKYVKELLNDKKVTIINRGVSGDKTEHLVKRYQKDFKDVNADYVYILIGINDVWDHYLKNELVTDEEFKNNYEFILSHLTNDFHCPIIILEPFIIDSDPNKTIFREELWRKVEIIRKLARKYATDYIPLDGIFAQASIKENPSFWSEDGIHPSIEGSKLIAKEIVNRMKF